MLNPLIGGILGIVKAEAHVIALEVMTGARGKITTLSVLLGPHAPVPGVPAGMPAHADSVTYRAWIVWQPGVVVLGAETNGPASILYSTAKPGTVGTVGNVNATAQVFAGAAITGAGGKIMAPTMLLTLHVPGPTEPAGVVPQLEASTYRAWTL